MDKRTDEWIKGQNRNSELHNLCQCSLPCLSGLIRGSALHKTSRAASVTQLVERLP